MSRFDHGPDATPEIQAQIAFRDLVVFSRGIGGVAVAYLQPEDELKLVCEGIEGDNTTWAKGRTMTMRRDGSGPLDGTVRLLEDEVPILSLQGTRMSFGSALQDGRGPLLQDFLVPNARVAINLGPQHGFFPEAEPEFDIMPATYREIHVNGTRIL